MIYLERDRRTQNGEVGVIARGDTFRSNCGMPNYQTPKKQSPKGRAEIASGGVIAKGLGSLNYSPPPRNDILAAIISAVNDR